MPSALRAKPIRGNQLYKAGNPVGIKSLIAAFVLFVLLPGMVARVRLGAVEAGKPVLPGAASAQELRRPLERGLLAVGGQVWRRCIRVALFGAVELADLAEVDLRETNLDLLVFLVVELAVAQLAFH